MLVWFPTRYPHLHSYQAHLCYHPVFFFFIISLFLSALPPLFLQLSFLQISIPNPPLLLSFPQLFLSQLFLSFPPLFLPLHLPSSSSSSSPPPLLPLSSPPPLSPSSPQVKEIINDSTDGLTFYSQPAMTVDAADLKQLYPMVKTPQWFQSYQETMGNHGCKETIFQVGKHGCKESIRGGKPQL